ncbi:hypothetical protein D3C78_1194900 [compost metagenome]
MSDGYQTVQGGFYNRVTDEDSTFRRDVSLVEGQTHTDESFKLKHVINSRRHNLVCKAVNVVRTNVGCEVRTSSLQEVRLEGLLNGTGAFSSTLSHQTINVSAIFTQVISHIPSITFVFGDLESDLTSLNRVVDQRGIFLCFLQSYRANSLNVESIARAEVLNVTEETFRQQAVVEVKQDEARVLLAFDKRASVRSDLHLVSLIKCYSLTPYLAWISALIFFINSACSREVAPERRDFSGRFNSSRGG